jgi:spore germination protein
VPTTTATPAGRVIHIVQAGETLSSIGRQYGVSHQAIMYVNGLEDPNLIELGQELIIPRPDEILPTQTPPL